ncbi:YqiA/YcfP family alpha/beta fold hydrolase [Psychrobacter sp. CAL346-MNA-CIBAN-0220]|uniref:YqiA/YcfP family alpha/beta fold hydrolase n=1 Tax=Psychrobacter sp. CAL346-MNA-CIBAN-0220 TaxID=3140457 RepID=UPI00331E20BE
MNIVYIHGLDSDSNSTKGQLLERYCEQNHPDITVLRPDLNKNPAQVFDQLITLIAALNKEVKDKANDKEQRLSSTVLVGSSLGGYYSTLVSNYMNCPALLLNPSIEPHITLQRFSIKATSFDISNNTELEEQVFYTTSGGWAISKRDIDWFAEHQLSISYPQKVAVLIKEGDELLDPYKSAEFYQQQGAAVTLQPGGDHRFSDFAEQLPMVIEILRQLR